MRLEIRRYGRGVIDPTAGVAVDVGKLNGGHGFGRYRFKRIAAIFYGFFSRTLKEPASE